MEPNVFLITGAAGCIGAWVLRHLVDQGEQVLAADMDVDLVRPRLLMEMDDLRKVTFARMDITEPESLTTAIDLYGVTHIIHLAALQIPFCKAKPALGARVNVEGTVNVFEAVRRSEGQVRGLAYASSIAALGPEDRYGGRPVADDVQPYPMSLYGVYKQADEAIARVYWQDWGVSSIGLRPFIVYGVGRDQGTTSDLTKAVLAAVVGAPYHIKFGGQVALQYAGDVARMLIECARAGDTGARVCNLRNDVLGVDEFVAVLRSVAPRAQITHADTSLPFPADLSDAGLRSILGEVPHTPLQEAIRETAERFMTLTAAGRIDLGQLAG